MSLGLRTCQLPVDYGKRTIAITTNIAVLYALLPTLYKNARVIWDLAGMKRTERV